MQLETTKAGASPTVGVGRVTPAMAGNVNSLSGWMALAVLAVLPPLVMMRWWHGPRQSMSESIQEARR